MALTEYLDYYQSLMAFQYRGLPRASANIRVYVAQFIADNFLEQLANCFTLSTAVGPQLDTIGKYIGAPRDAGVPLDTPLFGFWDYTESDPDAQNPNGFYDYLYGDTGSPPAVDVGTGDTLTISETTYFSSSTIDGTLIVDADFIQVEFSYAEFYSYLSASSGNTQLSDGQYRQVLLLKIFLNSNDMTLASIQRYLATYFPGQITVIDNADMTMDYFVSSSVSLPVAVLTPYLPRPMGVGITVTET